VIKNGEEQEDSLNMQKKDDKRLDGSLRGAEIIMDQSMDSSNLL